MKKFTKIISIVCILAFVLSLSAFAAIDPDKSIEYALKADKASYNVGDTVKVTLYSDGYTGEETFGFIYMYSNYDAEGLEFISDSTGKASTDGTGYLAIEQDLNPGYVADWSSIVEFEFKALKAGEFVFEFTDVPGFADMDANGAYAELYPSITITVTDADPKPELKNTYKLGDITYTDVPNITVTKNLASASISGDLLIDYLKDDVAYNTSKAFEVVLGAFSGAGDVTFDVALINVPSSVTVTGMDIALD